MARPVRRLRRALTHGRTLTVNTCFRERGLADARTVGSTGVELVLDLRSTEVDA
jgi:hypothetical protein